MSSMRATVSPAYSGAASSATEGPPSSGGAGGRKGPAGRGPPAAPSPSAPGRRLGARGDPRAGAGGVGRRRLLDGAARVDPHGGRAPPWPPPEGHHDVRACRDRPVPAPGEGEEEVDRDGPRRALARGAQLGAQHL